MFRKTFLAAAFLGIAGTPALAEYTVKGAINCATAIQEDAHEHFREYNKWWLLGYFTGRNYASTKAVGHGIEDESIYKMALDFCKNNPNKDWDDAAIHTYGQLD